MTENNREDSKTATTETPPQNNREREHEVLQQVLLLLAEPPTTEEDPAQLRANNKDLREGLACMAGLLRDRTGQCITLERKVSALGAQVASLKDVVTITRDLLKIRDMEVKHLNDDINNIEAKIDGERQRHNEMLGKMDAAAKLNLQLKQEYETQFKLFQELKEKYEQRAQAINAVAAAEKAKNEGC